MSLWAAGTSSTLHRAETPLLSLFGRLFPKSPWARQRVFPSRIGSTVTCIVILRPLSRDFARTCQTPMLVLPDDVAAHPLQTSIDIASLCPNAEITVFPWKEPPELKARTINRARTFLKRHQTA